MKASLRQTRRQKLILSMLVLGGVLIGFDSSFASTDNLTYAAQQTKGAQPLKLIVGKSTIVDVPVPIKRASLANPDIADAIVLSPKQIYVTGKGYGTTNLTLWGKDDQVFTIFDLDVGVDLSRLQSQLSQLLPDESNIQVSGSHDHVTLAGTVSSPAKLSQTLAVAEAYAPKRVINFLRVYPTPPDQGPPPQEIPQVTVEVIRGTAVNAVKF
jgi:pilus assembly protein CpaC